MILAAPHVLGIVATVLLGVALAAFWWAGGAIRRSPTMPPDGPMDGYTVIVLACAGLLAIFGVWAVAEVGEAARIEVDIGGHNAYGVFMIAFLVLIVLGPFLAILGRAKLREIADRRSLGA